MRSSPVVHNDDIGLSAVSGVGTIADGDWLSRSVTLSKSSSSLVSSLLVSPVRVTLGSSLMWPSKMMLDNLISFSAVTIIGSIADRDGLSRSVTLLLVLMMLLMMLLVLLLQLQVSHLTIASILLVPINISWSSPLVWPSDSVNDNLVGLLAVSGVGTVADGDRGTSSVSFELDSDSSRQEKCKNS